MGEAFVWVVPGRALQLLHPPRTDFVIRYEPHDNCGWTCTYIQLTLNDFA